jgi:E3 ubiquitin ligase SMURF1/2
MTVRSHQKIRVTILCARSLAKRDLFRLPDPFVRVNVDGSGQSHTTESCKNTLDPKWNVYYDLLLSSEDSITISVWNDKKIHAKKDGIVKLVSIVNKTLSFLRL